MSIRSKKDEKSMIEKGKEMFFPASSDNNSLENRIVTDPFGSWTGVNVDNELDKPVQDVDDL